MNEILRETPDPAARPGAAPAKAHSPWLKLALEMGPLALFLIANAHPEWVRPIASPFLPDSLTTGENAGLFMATLLLMVSVLAALAASWVLTRRLPVVPLLTAVLALVFGALTLYLHDATFIKMKPTILYVCFSAALFAGVAFNRPVLPVLFDQAMALTERGWRVLTLRWATFFLALAGLNELVWRTQSTNVWAAFKFPGLFIIVLLFTLAQTPFVMRNTLSKEEAERAPEHF